MGRTKNVVVPSSLEASPVRGGAALGSTNTDRLASPSLKMICETGCGRPGQRAAQLGDLLEAGRRIADRPARLHALRFLARLRVGDPALHARLEDRLHVAARHVRPELEVRERVLLDHLLLVVEGLGAHHEAGGDLRAQALRVAHHVPRIEADPLAVVAQHALGLAELHVVARGDRGRRGAQDRGEEARRDAPVEAHRLRVGKVAEHLVVAAHDLVGRPVEGLDALVLLAAHVHVRDAHRGSAIAVAMDEGARVRSRAGRLRGALQPCEGIVSGRGLRAAGNPEGEGWNPAPAPRSRCSHRAAAGARLFTGR